MAELQDVPVTETEKRGLSALAPLAGVLKRLQGGHGDTSKLPLACTTPIP